MDRLVSKPLDDFFHHLLRISEEHHGVVHIEDFVIDTGHGLEPARAEVAAVVQTVLDPAWISPRHGKAGLPQSDERLH